MSYIQRVAGELKDTLSRKNHDYTTTDEFSNFTEAARLPGVMPFDVMLGQLGIKYSRLLSLNKGSDPEFESLRDSFVDLAGYAVIAAAWLDREKEDSDLHAPLHQATHCDGRSGLAKHLPHWFVEAGDE